MGAFDTATAVSGRPGGGFEVEIDRRWTVADAPNGGYLMALMARAAAETAITGAREHPHPIAASASFLRAPSLGPATITTELLRGGRSTSQVRAQLVQDGRPFVDAVLTLARLGPRPEPRWSSALPVGLPAAEDCPTLPALAPNGIRLSILESAEVRLDPAVLGFASGRPGGTAEVRGWVRLADGQEPDPFSLLLMADVLPPATVELGSTGWVPTMQLTTYVRSMPDPGWLRVRQRASLVEGGMVDEVCEVWDSAGRLVAQAVQLALVTFDPSQ